MKTIQLTIRVKVPDRLTNENEILDYLAQEIDWYELIDWEIPPDKPKSGTPLHPEDVD